MAFELTPEQRQTLADALYAGKKITAVKQVRELSGLDLGESKDIVDRLEAELRAANPERFAVANRPKLMGCIVVAFIIALTAVILFYLFR
jgi:ribosomal protein L7/L12